MKFKIGDRVVLKSMSMEFIMDRLQVDWNDFVIAAIKSKFTVRGYDETVFGGEGSYILESNLPNECFHDCKNRVEYERGIYAPEDILRINSNNKSKIIKR